ncbi:MAG TPA: enoyl-CoA hydratase-related protein [Acidimicrobiia bacterium]|nr:enoyl-CoA hydratase-related protein [Acidimicrobiia bacterium]
MSELFSIHPDIKVTADGHVTTVTIDRPDTKNACTGDMWVAIGETFRRLAYSGTRLIVLTGGGTDFCAGADLSGSGDAGSGAGGSSSGPMGNQLAGMRVLGDAVVAVHGCPVPTIARVDGVAVGAGFGLSLACDLTVCSDRARFSAIFAKRGISLDFGTSWLLRQRIGVHRAKELALTARMVHGPEAYDLGLVNRVVPVHELDATTAELADAIAAGPPLALSMTKRELDNAGTSSLAQALEIEALAQSVNVGTEDIREALTAYVERRPPEFKGR